MSARPPRLGLLIPEIEGFPWLRTFEAALAAQVRFWGGAGNLVFPLTADFTDAEVFWAIADAFDPDAFLTYAPTQGESRRIAPAFHAERIREIRDQLVDGEPASTERFVEETEDHTRVEIQPLPEQLELLRHRLALFHDSSDGGRLHRFNSAESAPWPLTDVSEFNELPKLIQSPVLRDRSAARQLLVTATMGRMPDRFAAELIKDNDRQITELDLGPHGWIPLLRDRARWSSTPLWSIGEVGLGQLRSRAFIDPPATVVAGDSPWDFCLFYALLRLTGRAWWLPSWLARDTTYLLTLSSALEFEPRSEARESMLTSTSLPVRRCRELATKLGAVPGRQAPPVGDWREAMPADPQHFAVLDSETRMKQVQVFEGRILELDTLVPREPSTTPESYMRWIAEARGSDWAPIRHLSLAGHLLPDVSGNHGYARTSRDSVSYFPIGPLVYAGARLEAMVLRPSLFPLNLDQQIETILKSHGWKAEISDKGIYARESMQLFGGFDALCGALRDTTTRSVLEAYRAKTGPGARLTLDRRRYLRWQDLESVAASDTAVLRHLLDLDVLSPGFVLRCRRCRQTAWHRRALVTDQFVCERCSLSQSVDRRAAFDQDEPQVSYRLAEVIYQLLENRGELPLLAINDQFSGSHRRPRGHSFELDIRSPEGAMHEVDLFYSDGSSLWLGEASANPRFAKEKLEFLARLAEVLNARGVLLATSKTSWPDTTVEEANRVFPGPWPLLQMRDHVNTTP